MGGNETRDRPPSYTGSGNEGAPIQMAVGSTTPNNVSTQQLPSREIRLPASSPHQRLRYGCAKGSVPFATSFQTFPVV